MLQLYRTVVQKLNSSVAKGGIQRAMVNQCGWAIIDPAPAPRTQVRQNPAVCSRNPVLFIASGGKAGLGEDAIMSHALYGLLQLDGRHVAVKLAQAWKWAVDPTSCFHVLFSRWSEH